MRVLIAPDKFKGSLTAAEAAQAMEDGLRAGWPQGATLAVERLPIADGGEGTTESIHDALKGRWVTCRAQDPMGRRIEARYTLVPSGPDDGTPVHQRQAPVAVMEMSTASGLALVPPEKRNLTRASTSGTGDMLRHALKTSKASRIIIGIGGSATNDGGIGMAAALGFKFFDAADRELEPRPYNLLSLHHITPPKKALPAVPITVACDVRNPLLGERGATRIYGPQKGLRGDDESALLEHGLLRLAEVVTQTFGVDHRETPGAGAAGGLGFGLLTFCGATLRPGFELIAELLHLDAAVQRADFVLTGEGSLDGQTLEGKAPAGVAALARKHGKPVAAFAGRIGVNGAEEQRRMQETFDAVAALAAGPITVEESGARAGELLRASVARAAAWMQLGRVVQPR